MNDVYGSTFPGRYTNSWWTRPYAISGSGARERVSAMWTEDPSDIQERMNGAEELALCFAGDALERLKMFSSGL